MAWLSSYLKCRHCAYIRDLGWLEFKEEEVRLQPSLHAMGVLAVSPSAILYKNRITDRHIEFDLLLHESWSSGKLLK